MPFDGTQLDKTQLSEVTQTLIEGKRLIEKGWCQGAYKLESRVCMIGAVGGPTANIRAEAVGYLVEAIGDPCVVRWNDARGRTKEQILEAYGRAIELSMRS